MLIWALSYPYILLLTDTDRDVDILSRPLSRYPEALARIMHMMTWPRTQQMGVVKDKSTNFIKFQIDYEYQTLADRVLIQPAAAEE